MDLFISQDDVPKIGQEVVIEEVDANRKPTGREVSSLVAARIPELPDRDGSVRVVLYYFDPNFVVVPIVKPRVIT